MSESENPSKPQPAPGHWPLTLAVMLTAMLGLGLLTLYLAPVWAERWRAASDQAAADAVYLRRQAELRAESEAADQRLENLDRRFHLVSLGFRDVARKVAPVVVHIGSETEVTGENAEDGFFDFERNRRYVERSEGSGIVVKPGIVLTNRHVVEKTQRLRVTFASGRWVLAKPQSVSSDISTDLAIIRLPEDPGAAFKADYAVAAEFADSDRDVQVGDWVLAAGSPFGLRQSVTAGIISAKGRVELPMVDFVELIQTDAAINPGNSGGPLFDLRGKVVGINVAIACQLGRCVGVGFATPSNAAREVLEQLLENGEVVRGYLGIRMQEVPDGMGERLGLAETGAVVVAGVETGSPAAHAGIRQGDLIIGLDGEPLGTVNAVRRFRQRIAKVAPDQHVSILVFRHGERHTFDAVIGKRPPSKL
jgi:S1-C subfamily serine protease